MIQTSSVPQAMQQLERKSLMKSLE